jgi:membrane protein YdbS with pleckstrin-like domain
MNLHLAYQKEKVGKEAREKSPKQHTRKIWKLWAFLWIALLLGAVVGLIGWLLVRHGIVWWLLGGGIAGFLIVGLIYILVDKFGVFFKLKF